MRPRGILARYVSVVETGQPYIDEVCFPLANRSRWFRVVALKRLAGEECLLDLVDVLRDRALLRAGRRLELRANLGRSLRMLGEPGDRLFKVLPKAVERDGLLR